jgi:PIN domain nuclease of toxin-antitoxin system
VNLLLDTHIWLWSLLEPDRLWEPVAAALESRDNRLWLSPISVWEAVLLAEKGKIALDGGPEAWIARALRRVPVEEPALTRAVALRSRTLGLRHPDPADRFIAATASVYDLTLVTADERLMGCPDIVVLANR